MKTNNTKKAHVFTCLKTLKPLRPQLKSAQQTTRPSAVSTAAQPKLIIPKPKKPKDKELFLAAMRDVKPLKSTSQRQPRSTTSSKKQTVTQSEQYKRRQEHAIGHSRLPALNGISDYYSADYDEKPQSEYLNSICGTDVLRNLKKGRWLVLASIDLHGATLEQARLRLEYFLQHSLAEGYKCVRIVHGVGYGSKDNGPVLPTAVRRWLSQLDFVLAYTDCQPHEGGAGAVKVLLRL